MSSYTNIFGGSPVQPATVSYRSIALAANTTLVWATSFVDNVNVVARIMNVTPSAGGFVLTLPDATQVSTGEDFLIFNVGAHSFTINKSDGSFLKLVDSGESYYFWLTDNSTAAGTWSQIQFGAGTSEADANALAGYGLTPLNGQLNTNFPGKTIAADYQILIGDRASILVWTGGSGTITLPAQINGFPISINNEGSGVVTITTPDAKTIDGAANFPLNPSESSMFIGVEGNWNTLGFGVETLFSVNTLSLDIGTPNVTPVTLTNQQSSRLVQKYTGVLLKNIVVQFPAASGQWYIWNATTGAFSVTVKLNGIGAGFVVPQGEKIIAYSDGSEIYNTPTVTTNAIFSDGNVGAPGIAFTSQNTTGFYRISSGLTGYASAGTQGLTFGGATPGYALGISGGLAARFYNTANSGYVGFKALGALAGATALVWTLPSADATVSGQLLRSDAAATLSFTSAAYPNATTANQLLYSSATNTVVGLATANNGVLVTSAGGVPSIAATLPAAVQDNITRTGIIVSGTWSATPVDVTFGGTGLSTLTTAYGVVCAGTAPTGSLQNAGAGTVNQVLTSNGAAALPSWKAVTVALPAAVKANQTTGTSTAVYVNPAVQQFHDSAIKAAVTFKWNGAAVVISSSYNIQSVTYNNTGDYLITFTTPFATANYQYSYMLVNGGAVNTAYIAFQFGASSGGSDPTTTTFRILTVAPNGDQKDVLAGISLQFSGRQ